MLHMIIVFIIIILLERYSIWDRSLGIPHPIFLHTFEQAHVDQHIFV